jgi:hypothetical protein
MIKKNKVPEKTHLTGLRMMEEKDVKDVTALLKQYLSRFDLAPEYSEEEVYHWFLHKGDEESRVVWAYVVEVITPGEPLLMFQGAIDEEDHGLHLILFSAFHRHRKPKAQPSPGSVSVLLRD